MKQRETSIHKEVINQRDNNNHESGNQIENIHSNKNITPNNHANKSRYIVNIDLNDNNNKEYNNNDARGFSIIYNQNSKEGNNNNTDRRDNYITYSRHHICDHPRQNKNDNNNNNNRNSNNKNIRIDSSNQDILSTYTPKSILIKIPKKSSMKRNTK